MDLVTDLRLFVALARLGSLAAAGREIGMGTSSVARRLDALEDRLGERLFNRTPKGVFPTLVGQRRLPQARDLVETADEFSRRDGGAADLAGVLRLSCPARFGERCVAPIVARFLDRHPLVEVDLDVTDEVRDLDRDAIDVAIRIGQSAPEHNVARRVASNQRILVASPEWEAGHGRVGSVRDLDGIDGLMLGAATSWTLRAPDGTVSVVHPRHRFRGRGGDVVLVMCLAGLGIALKSAWEVQDLLAEGALTQLLPGFVQDSAADIVMVMPTRRLVPKLVRAFLAEFEPELKERLSTP